jgi:hypothetical protein
MLLYLGVAIVLFLLLFFVPKEGFGDSKGYYSDSNVTGAVDSLTALNAKLSTLKTTVSGFSTSNYSATEAISSIGKVLNTKDNELYTAGVVTAVKDINSELEVYQADILALNDIMIKLTTVQAVNLFDEVQKRKMPFTIPEAIDNLIKRSNDISAKLNKIPGR